MATIDNRSNYIVSIQNKPELKRSFPYSKRDAVKAYYRELTQAGYKPQVSQLENRILVRIRDKGYEEQTGRFDSMAEAQAFVKADGSQTTDLQRDALLAAGWLEAAFPNLSKLKVGHRP